MKIGAQSLDLSTLRVRRPTDPHAAFTRSF